MAELKITPGTKLTISYDVPDGATPLFEMVASFKKNIDDSAFLMSIPMKNGAALEVDDMQKFLISYTQGEETVIIAAYCDEIVREGMRRYWKMRRVTERRFLNQRADERVKIAFELLYKKDTWPLNAEGEITPETGVTIDISAGGIAFFLSWAFDVGEVIHVTLPRMGSLKEGTAQIELPGDVCWLRDAPKGSPYKRMVGVKFRFADEAEKQAVADYVAYIKKRTNA